MDDVRYFTKSLFSNLFWVGVSWDNSLTALSFNSFCGVVSLSNTSDIRDSRYQSLFINEQIMTPILQDWIVKLQKGEDPFTEEVMDWLRPDVYVPYPFPSEE